MLKCQYCDRELKNQGSKNLHERACKKNPANDETNEEIEKENKHFKKETCQHELVLLSPKVVSHKRAINDGYSAYCIKCNELV